jgi:hypothetical protein
MATGRFLCAKIIGTFNYSSYKWQYEVPLCKYNWNFHLPDTNGNWEVLLCKDNWNFYMPATNGNWVVPLIGTFTHQLYKMAVSQYQLTLGMEREDMQSHRPPDHITCSSHTIIISTI